MTFRVSTSSRTALRVALLLSLPALFTTALSAQEIAKLKASDAATDDRLGFRPGVTIDGDTVLVSGSLSNGGNGATYVFQKDQGGADNWGQVVELTATTLGNFGNYLAMDGDTAIVGSRIANPGGYTGRGAAYIYDRDAGGTDHWGQVKQLLGPLGSGRFFGQSVALSGDTAFVAETGPYPNYGRVYVYERNQPTAGDWGLVKTIEDPASQVLNDAFGISLDAEGDTLVVGADGKNANKGAIYIYGRDQGGAGNWGLVQMREGSDSVSGSHFSFTSLGLSGDVIVVGSANVGDNAAYVFERNQGGADNWGQVKKLTASDGDPGDALGFAVAVDGDQIVVTAVSDDDMGENQGSAYLFSRNMGGVANWGEVAKFTPSTLDDLDSFGHSAAISGNLIVVAAIGDDDVAENSGAAYIFNAASLGDSDGDGISDDLDGCPGSNLSATVIVGGVDSGVSNTVFANGCTLADVIDAAVSACEVDAQNHGGFVRCYGAVLNGLKREGLISDSDKSALQSAGAQAKLP